MQPLKSHLEFEKHMVDDIPILSCFKKDGVPGPLVIFIHSLGQSKEHWQPQLEKIADLGCYAIAMDNKGHGERRDPNFRERVFSEGKLNVYEVRKLIKETADDIPSLIDHFIAKAQIDGARIGIIGGSMGGFAAFRALVIDERIKVAAPIIASPYLDEVPKDVPVLGDPEVQQALEAYSRKYNPANYLEKFYPRAILIQIGEQDIHFNGKRVANFYQELLPHYREAPDRLKFIAHENIAHEITATMWRNVTSWLQKHL